MSLGIRPVVVVLVQQVSSDVTRDLPGLSLTAPTNCQAIRHTGKSMIGNTTNIIRNGGLGSTFMVCGFYSVGITFRPKLQFQWTVVVVIACRNLQNVR